MRRRPYPEITLPAILVGYVIGSVIAVSIGYLSLKLGFSIEGSELAAILGFGVLRGVMRRRSIIENNINQTIASAVNGASSGMMFSVPASIRWRRRSGHLTTTVALLAHVDTSPDEPGGPVRPLIHPRSLPIEL